MDLTFEWARQSAAPAIGGALWKVYRIDEKAGRILIARRVGSKAREPVELLAGGYDVVGYDERDKVVSTERVVLEKRTRLTCGGPMQDP